MDEKNNYNEIEALQNIKLYKPENMREEIIHDQFSIIIQNLQNCKLSYNQVEKAFAELLSTT